MYVHVRSTHTRTRALSRYALQSSMFSLFQSTADTRRELREREALACRDCVKNKSLPYQQQDDRIKLHTYTSQPHNKLLANTVHDNKTGPQLNTV